MTARTAGLSAVSRGESAIAKTPRIRGRHALQGTVLATASALPVQGTNHVTSVARSLAASTRITIATTATSTDAVLSRSAALSVNRKPDYWMEGNLIVQFRSGIRVLRIPTCTARCGSHGCPQNDNCRSYFVYQMRFYGNNTREWRRANSAGMPRDWAITEASRRALSAEAFKEDRAAIDRWNTEGCP